MKSGALTALNERKEGSEANMNVITISREFGSGGRELGRRLAALLGYAYYDREIEASIARRTNLDEGYISRAIEQGALFHIPLHFGRTIASPYLLQQQVGVLLEKQQVMRELAAASNCIVVGRAADVILAEYHPFKLFVYADMAYRKERCQRYARAEEQLDSRALEREIRKIDARRAQFYGRFSSGAWGRREHYHLCVNTTGWEIGRLAPHIAGLAAGWFPS